MAANPTTDQGAIMIGRLTILLLVAQGMAIAFHARAQEKIFVRAPAVYDKNAAVADNVKAECAIDALLGKHVHERVNEKFPGSVQVRDSGEAGKDKVLNVTILGVLGAGGGAWSGPKSITVRADLTQNNQVIATTVKQRSSTGGAFGGFKGTCAIMERIVVALGQDVAAWLSSPAAAAGNTPAKPAPVEAGSPAAAAKAENAPAASDIPSKPPASQEEK